MLPQIINTARDSLVSVTEENGVRVEKYVVLYRPDSSYPDTIVLRFDKSLADIPFTFSRELDSTRQSKLCQQRFITRAHVDTAQKALLPLHELRLEISKVPAQKDAFLQSLLK